MKKTFTFLLSLFCYAISFAQPNSIILQDGTGMLISDHSSIQEAYDAIPSALTQPYMIEVTGSYDASTEVFPVTFINKPGASAANTIRIYSSLSLNNLVVNYDGVLSSAFIFDDADWMIISGQNSFGGKTFRFANSGTDMAFPLIHFINGSCNNRIDSCRFDAGLSNISMNAAIEFGTSPGSLSGNSLNTIHYCDVTTNTLCISSIGTVNNPNDHNLVACNNIYPYAIGIWLKAGTGKTVIDSNYINNGAVSFFPDIVDIIIEDMTDSTIITRNRMRNYLFGDATVNLRGIYIKSTSGSNAYALLANNAICFQSAENLHGLVTDEVTYIAGIEYDGTYPIITDIYHNTVRIEEQLDSNLVIPGYSACFKRTGSNAANDYDIRNNIFSSERHGQTDEHFALDLEHTTGSLIIDHNDYHDITSYCIKYNNTPHSTFAAYQAAIGGANEANSTDAAPEFQGPFDHHVYGVMVNNNTYYGTSISGITEDIEGDVRTNPYMGCDEYIVNCTEQQVFIFHGPSWPICPGDTFLISSDLMFYGNGNTWQWQSRPAGTTGPFIDIPGATHYIILTTAYQSTEFRLQRSCADNSFTNYSPTHTVNVNPLPSAADILEVHVGMEYDFSASNPLNVTLFTWDFGDGSTPDSTAIPSHTYSDTGDHTVTLIVWNNCGSDTLTITVNPQPLGINDIELGNSISLFPNPSSGEVHITASGVIVESVSIYNTLGSIVATGELLKDRKLDVSPLATGNYIIQLRTDKGTVYKKLHVQR